MGRSSGNDCCALGHCPTNCNSPHYQSGICSSDSGNSSHTGSGCIDGTSCTRCRNCSPCVSCNSCYGGCNHCLSCNGTCNGCNRCNSCQGCVNCQTCVSCQSCNLDCHTENSGYDRTCGEWYAGSRRALNRTGQGCNGYS